MHQEGRGWLDFVQLREVTAENHYVMHLSQLSYDQARAGSNEFKRSSLSINALRACVYIRQLSSFRAPTLWFIDLNVTTCHVQYTFLSSLENGQNMTILEIRHFCMMRKWPPTVIRRAKH